VLFVLDSLGQEEVGEDAREPCAHRNHPVLAALPSDDDKLALLEETPTRAQVARLCFP
jgi:hypothetical protein